LKLTPISIVALIVSFLLSNIASAGSIVELQVIQGKVLVDQGEGLKVFEGIKNRIKPNSKLVMLEKSVAVLNYVDEQCFVPLAPESMVRVSGIAPCASKSVKNRNKTVTIEPANGAYTHVAASPAALHAAAISPMFVGGGFFAVALASITWTTINQSKTLSISNK
jgi:hypothetical protein